MRKVFSVYRLIVVLLLSSVLLGYGCGGNTKSTERSGLTTLERTIIPDNVSVDPISRIDDPESFSKNGYGKWHYGPGLPYQKRLDLMPKGYDHTKAVKSSTMLRFFTMTDVHLTDKESPGQAIVFAPFLRANGISVYSPLMLYTTHILDAAVSTINKIHKQNPFDLGIALGDLANSTQYNELRWFIDIMDGKNINPDSGIKDDPVPGPGNDYQDEFKAEGLDKSIPWYAAIGNHDHFWIGSKPLNERMKKALTGDSILQLGMILDNKDPDVMNERTFSTGTLDCSKLYAPIIGAGITAKMKDIPTIPRDPNRRSLSKEEFMNEFSNSTTLPKGHGFVQNKPENYFNGCYSFEPKSNVPLKIIVIDDTQDNAEAPVKEGIYGHGSLNNGRWDWLTAQLKAGQAENKLMIIAGHVPIGVSEENSPMDWNPAPGYASEKELIAQLQSFPNLILFIAGHRHLNNVTAFPSKDPEHPENSFWEVETKSLREFPEQMRTFDIVLNSDNTISIFTVNVDPDIKAGSQASIGRSYAIASNQIYKLYDTQLPTGASYYNAELVKQLTPEMQKVVMNYSAQTKK